MQDRTEYRETAQDRKDAEALAAIDAKLIALGDAVAALPDDLTFRSVLEAAQKTREDLERRRTRIVAEGEARLQKFYSDREALKRAFRKLRKDGFAASLSEPNYESVSEPSFAIAEAMQSGERYVFARRNQVAYAFQVEGPRWSRTPETGDTLTHVLYLSWGPIAGEGVTADASSFVGRSIVAALEAEGLRTSWTGSDADCVQVLGANVEADR